MSSRKKLKTSSNKVSGKLKKQKNFALELVLIKDKAGRLELWETMHSLDFATKAIVNDLTRIIKKG
jgi:hypothetical protein